MRRIDFPSLPDLWTNVRLFDISEVVMGQSPPGETYNENKLGLPFFQGKAEFGELYPTLKKWCSDPTRIAEAGDILISVRAPVGATNIAKEQCCIGRGLAAIRPNNDVAERDFLLFYFRAIEEFLSTAGYGSTFQAINKNELLNLSIPLPPHPEQVKIVSILRQANKLSRLRYGQISIFQKLSKMFFIEKFGNPFENPERYRKIQLKKVCDFIGGGTPSKAILNYWKGKIPWVSPKDMKLDYIFDAEDHISEIAIADSATNIIPPKSILVVTRSGILKHTFPCSINLVDVAINQDIKALVPKGEINPFFLLVQLKTITPLILKHVRIGATVHNLETELLKNVQIILPPLNLQNDFESIINKVKNIEELIRQNALFEEKFNRTIVNSSFLGDLTESWRKINRRALKNSAEKRDATLGIAKKKVTIKEQTPEERPWLAQPNRHWLMDQLSELQGFVYEALREWKGTLIPSEDQETFREQAFPVEHLEDANDQILRALHQLAGLGLIAKISLYNHEGDYVTAFRGLREEELSQVSDRQYLAKG